MLRSWRPTYPCFLTHIGLQDMPTEVLRQAHGYYWDSWDTDQVGRNGLRFKIFVPTLYEPALARHGGHIVIIQKVLDIDYDAIDDWAAHKAAVERYIMAHLERVIPGFTDKVVVKLSASALTSSRYTLNYQGAMLGWEMSPDQLGANRLDVVGPIDRLYLCRSLGPAGWRHYPRDRLGDESRAPHYPGKRRAPEPTAHDPSCPHSDRRRLEWRGWVEGIPSWHESWLLLTIAPLHMPWSTD